MLIAATGGILLLLTLGVFGMVFVAVIRPQIRLKKRMASIGVMEGPRKTANVTENRRQRRIQEKVQKLKEKGKKSRTDQIRLSLVRAGLRVTMMQYFLASGGLGLLAILIYMSTGMPAIGAIPVALAGALGIPKVVLGFMAKKRQKMFTGSFADAVDVVVRGIRSGLPLSECMNIIGREFEDPLGEEFRLIIEGERLGLNLEEIMRRGLERMPTSEFKFFAIVLQIQRQTGGNLAETLGNLSAVLRARKGMRDKVQALASEAKSSAMIIGCLPFFVAGMLSILNPAYLMLLFTETLGNYMLLGGLLWMCLGVAVMAKMINFEM